MYTFRKQERLCNQRHISALYASPHRAMVFPLSTHWMTSEGKNNPCRLQVVIVAPKKKLYHAVDRNRTKRLVRECYRFRKHLLMEFLEQHDLSMMLSINYIHNETPTFQQLSNRFDKLFSLLLNQLEQQLTPTITQPL